MSTPSFTPTIAQTAARASLFKSLHRQKGPENNNNQPLLLANVFDGISARTVASLEGCKALATASFALALSINKTDETLTLEDNLSLVKPIAAVADQFNLPLTVDIQDGYAPPGDLSTLRSVITRVITELGASGVNLEDSIAQSTKGEMISEEHAVERIRTVLQTARELGVKDFVVNARSDTFLMGGSLDESIRKGKRYLEEGGAETVFIFWPRHKEMKRIDVQKVIDELGGRVNVSCRLEETLGTESKKGGKDGREAGLTPQELGRMGSARVSIGPKMYLNAVEAMRRTAGLVFGK